MQYIVRAGLIKFAFHLVQIPDFVFSKRTANTIIEPPLCFTVGVIPGIVALSPTLHCTQTHVFDRKILNFDSSV